MEWLEIGGKIASWTTANNWPLMIAGIALIFRRDIKGITNGLLSMSSRVTRLGPLELRAQEQAQTTPLSAGEQMFDPRSIDVLDNDISLKPFYDHFAELLATSSINNQERYARAVRAWAFTIRARVFDEIAATIFETQIAALRKLALKPTDRRGLRYIHEDYERRAVADGVEPNGVADFDMWVQYPIKQELIEKERGRYSITELGRAFLIHLENVQPTRVVPL
jgi:hypothetical protein